MTKKQQQGAPARRPLVSPEVLGEIPVDPELMAAVLEDMAETVATGRRKRFDPIEQTLLSYCAFYGLDPDATLEPEVMLELAALTSRFAALLDVSSQSGFASDPSRLEALAEAACTARLVEADGKPAFQMLEFLGVLARIEGR